MNLLAHAILAYAALDDTHGLECTGALMADYFTGQTLEDYPSALRVGILHHRAVDEFTDSHAETIQLTRTIARAGAPRFTAGILADIFWDHVLASEWELWGSPLCACSLDDFCALVADRLGQTRAYHSPSFSKAYEWLVGQTWLPRYAHIDGIERTLAGLSAQMSGDIRLERCISLLVLLDKPIRKSFSVFWPRLVTFARGWRVLRS